MRFLSLLLTLGWTMLLAVPAHATGHDTADATDHARRREAIDPALQVLTQSRETVRGVVAAVDQRNDKITLRLAPNVTDDFKIQDGLLFNAVRFGDQVEVAVQVLDGTRTIVGLWKE